MMLLAMLYLTMLTIPATIATLYEAVRDRQVLLENDLNGIREAICRASIRHEAIRLVKHVLIVFALGLGTDGALWANWATPETRVALRSFTFWIVAMGIAFNSAMDLNMRHREIPTLQHPEKMMAKPRLRLVVWTLMFALGLIIGTVTILCAWLGLMR